MKRPSKDQYDQALALYRGGVGHEEIAYRVGIDPETVDVLEFVGFPAKGRAEELPSFKTKIQDRLVRIRNSQLDWAQSTAETAAKTAEMRGRSASVAADLELRILKAWVAKASSAEEVTDPSELCMPKNVLDNLRVLRGLQDPAADVKFADLFRFMAGDSADDKVGSGVEDIVAELAALSPEEQEHYANTGQIPKPQGELFEAS